VGKLWAKTGGASDDIPIGSPGKAERGSGSDEICAGTALNSTALNNPGDAMDGRAALDASVRKLTFGNEG
jgi:hypothetical protein